LDELPQEIHQVLSEIQRKDYEVQSLREKISNRDVQLRKLIKNASSDHERSILPKEDSKLCVMDLISGNLEQEKLFTEVLEDFQKAKQLADDKIHISQKSSTLLGKHLNRLIAELESLQETDIAVPSKFLEPPSKAVTRSRSSSELPGEDSQVQTTSRQTSSTLF
ncbi:hypothetical protein HK096_011479, partial [Nowakowskiella sp. JEL0078]